MTSCDHCEKNCCLHCKRMEFCFGCNKIYCVNYCKSFSDCLACGLTMCGCCAPTETKLCNECTETCGAHDID